ncbi:hypothetical protein E4P39_19775 [Blastococcus sp. CT_GayMR19]|uniref:hypothetical protein n=1 Tax=Blastococcus sp. CT_GayMR19 TaxID=2559608 RepID=UPI00107429FC|nr:hypothetical protein [Blastococcus sp. CT_GayMR19]TFV70525.1 hypothetical protein E4P39_19775 [Blastococcus sp. CT_GayMR19]
MNRSVALGAAWSASAVAAVGLGFLAVSLVDASATPSTSPVAATTTASTTPEAPSGTSPSPVLATGEYATVAGTVFADCTSGSPVLAGAPAVGWWADDSNRPGEFEFKSGNQKLEVHVSCVSGSPQFFDEGLRTDDSGGSGSSSHSSSSSAASSSSAGHSSGYDDSSGRDGGGHGSDDSGGDDSSGRGGSGHGSDD